MTVGSSPPVADFTGTPIMGDAPLPVSFADLSTGSPTSWSWTLGDGGTSIAQNPSHTYVTPGTYTVTLEVTKGNGSDTVTTVQGWKERGSIPPARHAQILAAAETEGLVLSDEDLMVGGERSPTPLAEEAAPETIEPDFTEPPDIAEPIETLAPEPPQEPPPAYAVRTKPARSPARAALLGGLAGIVVAAGMCGKIST